MSGYEITLALHNITRWFVVVLGILAVVRAFLGWFGKRPWTARDRSIGTFFGIAMDVQLLLGLLLYFVFSPITRQALRDFGAAMSISDLRYFAVEHLMMMLLAVIFVHIGTALSRKAKDDVAKHRTAAIFFVLTILFVLAGIPWSRPLFPGLGGA